MRLLEWRTKYDKGQAEIAEKIGVKVSQISKIERGETFVSPVTGDAIRKLTGGAVTLDDLHDQWRDFQTRQGAA